MQFANISNFNNSEIISFILLDKISSAVKIQLEKDRNNSVNKEQDLTNPNNLESKLSKL